MLNTVVLPDSFVETFFFDNESVVTLEMLYGLLNTL